MFITIDPAGVGLQTAEQFLVASGGSGLDGQDEPGRERRVTVAQLAQLNGESGQPSTQHPTPGEDREQSVGLWCETIGAKEF
jgi:hypothetical protein